MHRRRLCLPSSSQTWRSTDHNIPAQTGSLARVQKSLHCPSGYKVWHTGYDRRNITLTKYYVVKDTVDHSFLS